MRKRDEINNPTSCLNKAREDELIFVFLARDEDAPDTIRHWVKRRVKYGKNKITDAKMVDALEWANEVELKHIEEFWLNYWRKAEKLFIEDDALPPDMETAENWWKTHFGSPRSEKGQITIIDGGDCFFHFYGDGRIFASAPRGGNEIRMSKELAEHVKMFKDTGKHLYFAVRDMNHE